jgi:SAM-dependent methyltransferase
VTGYEAPAAVLDRVDREIARLGRADHGYFRAHRARYEHDLQVVARHPGHQRILELGAFPFHMTAALALAGRRVTAVDLDPGRGAALMDRLGLDVRRCDIERQSLPFEDAAFDLVLLCETLEHLRVDPQFALSEVNRVLRPGGLVLLTTPNLYAAQNLLRFVLGRGFGDAVAEFSKLRSLGHMGHVLEYTPREVCRFALEAGFSIRAHRFHDYARPRGRREMLKFLAFKVLPARVRSFQVVIAEKTAPAPMLAPLPLTGSDPAAA